jgi:hypothetical protein
MELAQREKPLGPHGRVRVTLPRTILDPSGLDHHLFVKRAERIAVDIDGSMVAGAIQ